MTARWTTTAVAPVLPGTLVAVYSRMGRPDSLRPVQAWLLQVHEDGDESRTVAGVFSPDEPGELIAADTIAHFAVVVSAAEVGTDRTESYVRATVAKRELAGLDGELAKLLGETSS